MTDDHEVFEAALCAAEARVFAEAAIKMLQEGELEQAALLLHRAAEFAQRAA